MSSLSERRQALVEAFYAKQNQELLAQLREDLDAKRHREELKNATGIRDDGVLDHVLELGVNVESLAAMSIAPLVFVAWADGSIAAREREAIMSGAEQAGFKVGSAEYDLLLDWLSKRPGSELTQAWNDYTRTLCEGLAAADQIKLKENVLGRSQRVAEAAGGFLGLGSISAKEQAVLDDLKKAFEPKL